MKPNSSAIEAKYLDLRALSVYTSLSVSTWREILKRPGAPNVYRLPEKILLKKSDVDKWLEQYRQDPIDLDEIVAKILNDL
jgi:hypothetical protein